MNSSQKDRYFNFELQFSKDCSKANLPDQQIDTCYKNRSEVAMKANWWQDSSSPELSTNQPCQEKDSQGTNLATDCTSESLSLEDLQTENDVPVNFNDCKSKKRKAVNVIQRKELNKRYVVKNARLNDLEFYGKEVVKNEMGPPCNCRLNCQKKVNDDMRKNLHDIFWKTCTCDQRKQYIALSITESPKRRSRCRKNEKSNRRQVTFTYAFLINGDFVTVCKSMFLSTFSVSEKFVRLAMEKKRISPNGVLSPDKKPKKSEVVKDMVRDHIRSFLLEQLSYSKDDYEKNFYETELNVSAMHKLYVKECQEKGLLDGDTVKQNYYREIFKSEFSLEFDYALDSE